MTTLYLCYQSLFDPLTQTQVVAYLEGLARGGYRPILLTFEPSRHSAHDREEWRRRLLDLGIDWRHLRYHKRPTVPATALDIACGVAVGLWLIARFRVRLVHARSHVPAVMAAVLSAVTGRPFLFDIRGFLAEEYADAQVWPVDGFLFRSTKRVERALVRRASGLVVLTESAAEVLRQWYPAELEKKPLEVIPCCVDRRPWTEPENTRDQCETAETGPAPALVYVGKLGGWYPTEQMLEFFAAARERIPGLTWTILTQSDTTALRAQAARLGLHSLITIGSVSPLSLLAALAQCSAGLCLYRRELSAPACSPTKVPEYLAAGLPVVASRGVGDLERILRDHAPLDSIAGHSTPIGVVVDERDPNDLARAAGELRLLLADPGIRARARDVARCHFDLEAIGWTRYRRIYGLLSGYFPTDPGAPGPVRRAGSRGSATKPVPAADICSMLESSWTLKTY